jgi:hypothetical protein
LERFSPRKSAGALRPPPIVKLRVFVDFLPANLFPLRKAKQTEQETAE